MAVFQDEDSIRKAIAAVRADADPTNWMAITTDGKSWHLAGQGSGGVDEMKGLIKDDNIIFSVFRLTDKIDETVAVKFVMLNWLGEGVGRMVKARLSTQRGSIEQLLQPYHTDHTTSDAHEVTTEYFMKKVMNASGTAVHVLEEAQPHHNAAAPRDPAPVRESHPTPAPAPARSTSGGASFKAPSVPRGAEKSLLKYADEAGVRKAIKDVRLDDTPLDWVVVRHAKDNSMTVAGTGSGDISNGLLDLLQDDSVCYCLVRKEERIDESVTVKFAFVSWVGERVAVMHKANLAPIKGEVDALFHPWHVDLAVTNKSEISDEIIVTKIGKTSGTNSSVKE